MKTVFATLLVLACAACGAREAAAPAGATPAARAPAAIVREGLEITTIAGSTPGAWPSCPTAACW